MPKNEHSCSCTQYILTHLLVQNNVGRHSSSFNNKNNTDLPTNNNKKISFQTI